MENKYLITIALKNGDEVNAKAVAENTTEAIIKLLSVRQVKDFINDANGIESIKIKPNYIKDVEPTYKLEKSAEPNKWVLTDTSNMIVFMWLECRYNDTVKITPLYDIPNELQPLDYATLLRQAGEWLYNNHKELI